MVDIFAADRVVSLLPGVGTDLTIQSAINNLPPRGGSIFVKAGTYHITTSLVTSPGQDVWIRGSGPATVIRLGSHAIPAFTMNGGAFYLEALKVRGTGIAGQVLLSGFAGTDFEEALLRDVISDGIEVILSPSSAGSTTIVAERCRHNLPSQPTSFYFKDPSTVAAKLNLTDVVARDAVGLYGGLIGADIINNIVGCIFSVRSGLDLEADQSKYDGVLFQGDVSNPIVATVVGNFLNCTMGPGVLWRCNDSTAETQFLGCRIHAYDNVNPPIFIGPNVVNAKICNCDFFPPPDSITVAIEMHGNHCLVVSNYNCSILEVTPADFNLYDALIGFGGSTLVGANSVVGTTIP